MSVLDLAEAEFDKIPGAKYLESFLGFLKEHPKLTAIGVGAITGIMGAKMGDNWLEAGINGLLSGVLTAEGHPLLGAVTGLGLDMLGKNHGTLAFMAESTLAMVMGIGVGMHWLMGNKASAPSAKPADEPAR